MFPYPSGRIHMGHVRNYTMGDVLARYKRAQGFNVLHPMGWDAFGMPAENAAMERKTHPAKWTYENIDAMKAPAQVDGAVARLVARVRDLRSRLLRAPAAAVPRHAGQGPRLPAQSAKVNWDPVDQTVLANEQVIDGRGWRSGALVEQRELTQWFFRITAIRRRAARRARHARQVAGEGAPDAGELDRPLRRPAGPLGAGRRRPRPTGHDELEIFTTRPDTLFGASFMAIAPDHPLAQGRGGKESRSSRPSARSAGAWARRSPRSRSAEKMGFDTGIKAIHPLDPTWKLPVYVANFILMDYGTGAIFGCPAHDQRDIEFARKYGLPVIPVVAPKAEPKRARRRVAEIARRRRLSSTTA